MTTIRGVVRVLSPAADAGQPAPGQLVPEHTLALPILDDVLTLGSDLHNAVVLFDPEVESEHALLRYQRGAWTLENLAEKGVVRVEDVTVPPHMMAAIAPGQCFQVGTTRMQLVAPDLPLSLMVLAEEGPYASQSTTGALLQNPRALWRAPRGLARLGLLAVLGGFIIAFVLVAIGLGTLITNRVLTGGGSNVLAALTLPLIPAAGIILLTALIDRYEREPWYLLLSAFLWGAIIAIPPAVLIEKTIVPAISALSFPLLPRMGAELVQSALLGLNYGVTEEVVKGAGLIALLLIVRDRFENITDGILYGAIIGAGFAMTENIAYFVTAESSRLALTFLIVGRVLLGWLGHSTFTACFGAGLGYMRERRAPLRPWLPPLLGFLVAVCLHSLFDFVNSQATIAVNDAPASALVKTLTVLAIVANYIPLVIAAVVLWTMLQRSLAREAGVLREYLVDEVRQGVVTPEEYVVLQHASARQRLQRALLLLRGARLWWATRSLHAAIVGLAFAKWRASIPPGDTAPPFAPPNAYRARIRRLRRLLRDSQPPADQAGSSSNLPSMSLGG